MSELIIGRSGRELEEEHTRGMDEYAKLEALTDLAASLGITVRQLPGAGQSAEHPGGSFVRLKGKDVLFLDPTAGAADQTAVAAAALRGRAELRDRFLPPEVRQLLEAPDAPCL